MFSVINSASAPILSFKINVITVPIFNDLTWVVHLRVFTDLTDLDAESDPYISDDGGSMFLRYQFWMRCILMECFRYMYYLHYTWLDDAS